jgi:hypothetical protein
VGQQVNPQIDEFFYCFSRGAVLRCVQVDITGFNPQSDQFEFEYVTTSKKPWAVTSDGSPQEIGIREWISFTNLTPLKYLNEMEVLAWVSR